MSAVRTLDDRIAELSKSIERLRVMKREGFRYVRIWRAGWTVPRHQVPGHHAWIPVKHGRRRGKRRRGGAR